MKMRIRLRSREDIRKFVEIASRYAPNMELVHDRYTVDAKSILGIFSMDLTQTLDLMVSGYVYGLEEELGQFLAA